jgi:hypothetical protein
MAECIDVAHPEISSRVTGKLAGSAKRMIHKLAPFIIERRRIPDD